MGKPPRPTAAACPSPISVSLDDSVAVAVLIPEREHRRHALAEAQHLGVGVDATSPKRLVRGVRIVGGEATSFACSFKGSSARRVTSRARSSSRSAR
jgi:hypothetical protein